MMMMMMEKEGDDLSEHKKPQVMTFAQLMQKKKDAQLAAQSAQAAQQATARPADHLSLTVPSISVQTRQLVEKTPSTPVEVSKPSLAIPSLTIAVKAPRWVETAAPLETSKLKPRPSLAVPSLTIAVKSPRWVEAETLAETSKPQIVRVSLPRATKMLPAMVTGKEPELTYKYEKEFQVERVKKFGPVFGLRFNALIRAWQIKSKSIRQFFLDGSLDKFSYGEYLQWNAEYTQLNMRYTSQKDYYDELLDLDAFWNVMTKGPLDTFTRDTVLYRGVSVYPGEQFANVGYVMENVLTNWTSSPTVARKFATLDGAMYACTFPKGTRYFYTGEAVKEFEYIIPGGLFQLSSFPKAMPSRNIYMARDVMTLLEFRFLPDPKGQFFPWPSKSKSPSTRAQYQATLEKLVLPDLIGFHLTVNETTTLAEMVQEFEKLKKRTGYVGKKTLFDYHFEFLALLQRRTLTHATVQKLENDYDALRKSNLAATTTTTSSESKTPVVGLDFMNFKIGGALSVRFQPRLCPITDFRRSKPVNGKKPTATRR